MRYVLGIDGGGTKTVCVLMDEIGQVISRGEAGPANYQVVGLDRVRHSIEQAIEQALEPAIAHSCQSHVTIQGMGLGLAGIGRPEDFQAIRLLAQQIHTQSELPVQWHLHPNAVITGSDSLTALVGVWVMEPELWRSLAPVPISSGAIVRARPNGLGVGGICWGMKVAAMTLGFKGYGS